MGARKRVQMTALLLLALVAVGLAMISSGDAEGRAEPGREEVVFWHFWGGADRSVVEEIVERFNQSQDKYQVRPIAMPGNNLDLKLFLSLAGGDPPDLVNQDDPIVADWAERDALVPLEELATKQELAELDEWLFPAARRLGSYEGRMFALCNGLDIRALYFNETVLEEYDLLAPKSIDDLDRIAETISPVDHKGRRIRFGYLPDPRRLWAWGIVFGGEFYDEETGEVTADSEPIVRSLEWIASFGKRYGPHAVQAFRTGDQALSSSSFPLLNDRRYAVIMDGQWRVREIHAYEKAAKARNETPDRFGVAPLPPPSFGRKNAGWVNGNFFVVPRGASCPQGAWEFMKFWSGFSGNEAEAARACAAGGWIPASQAVVDQPAFQKHLDELPLFRPFVELAASENQIPIPSIPVATYYQQEIERAAQDALYRGADPRQVLKQADERVQRRLDEVRGDSTKGHEKKLATEEHR